MKVTISRIMDKLWFIHTLEYYSAIKRNNLLIHITTWTNLKNIILSERNLTQKGRYYMIPLIWSSRIGKTNIGWKNNNCVLMVGGTVGTDWEGTWEKFCSDDTTIYLSRGLGFIVVCIFQNLLNDLYIL